MIHSKSECGLAAFLHKWTSRHRSGHYGFPFWVRWTSRLLEWIHFGDNVSIAPWKFRTFRDKHGHNLWPFYSVLPCEQVVCPACSRACGTFTCENCEV